MISDKELYDIGLSRKVVGLLRGHGYLDRCSSVEELGEGFRSQELATDAELLRLPAFGAKSLKQLHDAFGIVRHVAPPSPRWRYWGNEWVVKRLEQVEGLTDDDALRNWLKHPDALDRLKRRYNIRGNLAREMLTWANPAYAVITKQQSIEQAIASVEAAEKRLASAKARLARLQAA